MPGHVWASCGVAAAYGFQKLLLEDMIRRTAGVRTRSLSSSHQLLRQAPSRAKITMRTFTVDSLNPAVRNVQYAVRGELAIKAEEYRIRLKEKGQDSGLPFDRIISSNIGNPQQKGLDQPPLTFNRQVSSIFMSSFSRR